MRLLTPSVYAALATILAPLARLYLLKRAKRQQAYREHWDERFARCTYPAPDAPRLWLHAVSVGETVAAKPVIEAFLKEFPGAEILLTCMTPTGRETGAKIAARHPGRIRQCYLPYDAPAYAAKFLDDTKPRLGVFMDTEVWPNVLFAAKERNIPVVLANARESEKSMRQAEKVIGVMKPAFASFAAVLAQSDADAERFAALGAENIEVAGSVKFDIRADAAQVKAAKSAKKALGRDVLLIASTRKGEEAMLAPYLSRLPEGILTVIVPRHPERFDETAAILEREKVSFVRKSLIATEEDACGATAVAGIPRETRVLLGDTMGEMSFYCALADACIMGGSFGGTGCQNLIEPAAAGAPVIVGPSTFNFAQAAADAVKEGGAVQVGGPEEAVETACRWLGDRTELGRRSEAARRFAASYTGATERTIRCLRRLWS